MEDIQVNGTAARHDSTESSIFDDLKPMPEYYSQRAIYGFSIFGGVFFGAILMAVNLKNTESKKGIWQMIVFGIAYTALQIWLAGMIPNANTGISIAFSIPGGALLKSTFWNIYIGKDVLYTKRSVLVPAIVLAVIFVAFLLLLFYIKPA